EFAQDPKIASCLTYAAWTLCYLGYPDQGLQRSQEAVDLASRLSHPFSLALALGCVAAFHCLRREEQLVRERAEAAISLSIEQGFPYWLAGGMILRGRALAEQGQGEVGIAQMHQGLAAWQAMGGGFARPWFLALLAEAYGKWGKVEEGLSVLTEALGQVDRTGERYYEAELYRLKGELSLQSTVHSPQSEVTTPQSEAEGYFHKAIEVARRQSAKSLELRAVMSLSRLWQQQGKRAE